MSPAKEVQMSCTEIMMQEKGISEKTVMEEATVDGGYERGQSQYWPP